MRHKRLRVLSVLPLGQMHILLTHCAYRVQHADAVAMNTHVLHKQYDFTFKCMKNCNLMCQVYNYMEFGGDF